jgi:hypothetical protein
MRELRRDCNSYDTRSPIVKKTRIRYVQKTLSKLAVEWRFVIQEAQSLPSERPVSPFRSKSTECMHEFDQVLMRQRGKHFTRIMSKNVAMISAAMAYQKATESTDVSPPILLRPRWSTLLALGLRPKLKTFRSPRFHPLIHDMECSVIETETQILL